MLPSFYSALIIFSSFHLFFFLSRSIITTLIFLLERHFIMKNIKAFYFLFAWRKQMPNFLCSCSVLSFWFLLIKADMNILHIRIITSIFAAFVMYTLISMLRITILKKLDCCFHEKNFFANIQVLISNEYFLQKLMGYVRESKDPKDSIMKAQLKWIKGAINSMRRPNLRTICNEVESSDTFSLQHQVEHVISLVLRNLTNNEPRDIQEADLLLVMKEENVAKFLQLFHGATETKSITQESLKTWMAKVCNERQHVVRLLNSTSKGIEQLGIILWATQFYMVLLFWCRLMRIVTTINPAYLSPILLIFGKIIFDGVELVTVMNSIEIGDQCIIDDEQLVAERLEFYITTFRKDNNQTVNYSNSLLLSKSITNLSRSSGLIDAFEILVSVTTSSDKIASLKLKIDEFIGSKPEIWRAEFCFDFKGVDDGRDIYNLEITNLGRFQNYKVKKQQRFEFILKLKRSLEDLGIINFTVK
ncbi:mechanosensitive ion channel protein 4-like isoform X2 [Daucus carota subsp. sativus]|uniref:mechanosensitive ion channel protein 4-like isoform X2 n=1 Tax=Daucus carota subsp. sativus TaxID=79200 RepID=UPI003083C745